MSNARGLRVLACDVRGQRGDLATVSELIRQAEPDVAVVIGAPWRLRTRTRAADLAARSGLYAAAGSQASVGNVIFVSLRVRVIKQACDGAIENRIAQKFQALVVIRACTAMSERGVAMHGRRKHMAE